MYVIHLLAGCRLSRRGRPSLASLLSPFSSRLCLPSISFLSRSTGLPPFARPTDASSLSPSSPLHPRSYQSLAHHAVVCLPTASAPPPPQRHAQHGPRSQGSRWRILRVRVPPPLSLLRFPLLLLLLVQICLSKAQTISYLSLHPLLNPLP